MSVYDIMAPEAGTKVMKKVVKDKHWTVHTNEALSYDRSRAKVVLESLTGKRVSYVLQFDFKCSNNKAEYEALLTGLQLAMSMHIMKIRAYGDSMLVVNQVNSSYEANEEHIKKYLAKVKEEIN